MGDFPHITIDFEKSHLVFPAIIAICLALMAFAILIRDRKAIANTGPYWRAIWQSMDKPRFIGTLGLTLLYFTLMEPVGRIWPNTGMGFLLCSIPFVGLSGLLFAQDRSFKSAVPILLVAGFAPLLVWWLFTHPFFLTLP